MRPATVVVVTGTGTEVGKTWVGAAALGLARSAGRSVTARKPAQSFDRRSGPTDGELLAGASGEDPATVCSPEWSYPVPMAPPMAALELGRPAPRIADLAAAVDGSWPTPAVDLGLVEGAGGVSSPLAIDGTTADLARLLGADVAVLVADAGLGTINSVRLSAAALAEIPVQVHLNRFDPSDRLHQLNLEWLAERDGFAVTTDVVALLDEVLPHLRPSAG